MERLLLGTFFGFNDGQSSMFSTVFVLHILQQCLLGLGSFRYLDLRINIHSLVPLPKWSQHPERMNDMCWNEKHTGCWSYISILFGQLLSRNLHGKVYVFHRLSLLLSYCLHNIIHMMEHVIVDSDNVMQSNRMPCHHPQGAVLESSQNIHDVLDSGLFILCCEEWPGIIVCCILEPLGGEFSWSVGSLKQLQCLIILHFHIHKR